MTAERLGWFVFWLVISGWFMAFVLGLTFGWLLTMNHWLGF